MIGWDFVLGAIFGALCVSLPLVGARVRVRQLEATLDRLRRVGSLVDSRSKSVRGKL